MNKNQYFTEEVIQKLKYYVYIYIDPFNNEIFYIGKGKGNRAFSHLNDTSESDKTLRIKEIRSKGKEPVIEILVHGLQDEQTALRVEASVIDLIGLSKLTNKKSGYKSSDYGRMSIEQVLSLYASPEVTIEEPSLLIRINREFRYGMSPIELYDATRGVWKIGKAREKVKYAFAVYGAVIQEIYEVITWLPAGSTLSTRGNLECPDRWEFIGKVAPEDIRGKYIFKNVSRYFNKNSQNPFLYVNIEE